MISSTEGILFECLVCPKVVTISEMVFNALQKTIMGTIGGCRILLNLFYLQPVYLDDGCIEYDCMEIKRDNDVEKMFFIYSEFSSKDLIELNATFAQSLDEILTLLRKPRSANRIIAFDV